MADVEKITYQQLPRENENEACKKPHKIHMDIKGFPQG